MTFKRKIHMDGRSDGCFIKLAALHNDCAEVVWANLLKVCARRHQSVSGRNLQRRREELHQNVLNKIARHKTVTVMCLNAGNLDLVFNFICSCRHFSIDISNLIVFAADQATHATLSR